MIAATNIVEEIKSWRMKKPAVGDPACAWSRWWEVDVATTSVASQTTMLTVQTHLHRGKHRIGSAMAPELDSGWDKLWVLVSPQLNSLVNRVIPGNNLPHSHMREVEFTHTQCSQFIRQAHFCKKTGTYLSEEAHLTGSIRAFVANQVSVAIPRFFGLNCAPSKIFKCASSNWISLGMKCAPLKQWLFNKMCPFTHNIILHGSHSHNLYWIYALLSRNQPCRDYALWEALFWPKFGGGRH